MASGFATVTQTALNKAPMVSEGTLSPEVLDQWRHASRAYFRHARIEEDQQVAMISFSFSEQRIRDWLSLNEAELFALNFDEFAEHVADEWLPPHWKLELSNKLLSSRQRDEPFWDWHIRIQKWNALLGPTDKLSDTDLQRQMASALNPRVQEELLLVDVSGLDFCGWCSLVNRLDLVCLRRAKDIADEAARLQRARSTNSSKALPSVSVATTRAQGTGRLPALTDSEHTLLRKYNGCFKCRRFQVDHISAECPHGFPAVHQKKFTWVFKKLYTLYALCMQYNNTNNYVYKTIAPAAMHYIQPE
ncbi:hypothetical protein DENSPDRAFT_903143 [Dentipellis sp. KUC8613]|nr:hypothetical protein DENSPDRAFT_903143 [Dentipellis sp. KUC8613]